MDKLPNDKNYTLGKYVIAFAVVALGALIPWWQIQSKDTNKKGWGK